MLDVAFFHGFPHTDIPGIVVTVVATADGDAAQARRAARAVGRRIWELRDNFLANLPGADEGVRRALASGQPPVILAEVSDNPGGGGPGDGTHLLRALLAANVPQTCFGFVFDPETARQAHAAGAGATIRVRLGGRTDTLHGAPVEADAYVKCLTDGQFVYTTPMGRGSHVDLGPMARLVIGNVDVLVSSVRTQTLDTEVFLLHGIDVARQRVVALKSQQHFRAGFEHVAGEIIRVDTPGLTSSNLSSLPFERLRRPIWPLDRAVTYP
jgi:microcystin degradation protein MlrC